MRVRGANALLNGKFESAYGTPPSGNWNRLPFVSSDLGEERGFIESDLLGQGREPYDPSEDVANDAGDLVVPVDTRNIGIWLKLMFGAATSGAGDAATGSLSFSAQPAVDSTITINGTVFTFKASGATTFQINIGADVAATVAAVVAKLNASADGAVDDATYAVDGDDDSVMTVTHDTAGVGSNAFTLAASAGSNATVSGATLSGGNYSHVFTSGLLALPSLAVEIVHPELAKPYHVHYGVRGGTFRIAMSRRGLLNATLGVVARGELAAAAASSAGTPTELAVDRFAQATGEIMLGSDQLGNVVSSEFSYSNNLDLIETIQPDGRIEDADAAMGMAGGNTVMRFADQAALDAATADQTPVSITRRWTKGAASLAIVTPRVFIPRVKRSIGGPEGIQVTRNLIAAKPSGGRMVTVTLKNDVASY